MIRAWKVCFLKQTSHGSPAKLSIASPTSGQVSETPVSPGRPLQDEAGCAPAWKIRIDIAVVPAAGNVGQLVQSVEPACREVVHRGPEFSGLCV